MEPAFDWDDANIEHIARHGLALEEVEEALLDRHRIVRPTYRGADARRWQALRVTDAGRMLSIVFTERRGMNRVVTARNAGNTEAQQYRRGRK